MVYSQTSAWRGKEIELVKFAASASKTEQPCDVSPSFRILKQAVNSKNQYPTSFSKEMVERFLGKIPAASKRTFGKFLRKLPAVLREAFSPWHVAAGWQNSGLWPLDVTKILDRCATWKDMSRSQAAIIVASIPRWTMKVIQTGELSDSCMQSEVGIHILFDEWTAKHMGWDATRTKDTTSLVLVAAG